MRVLIIKTSSLGDIVHTLPALTDAADAIPGIQFDWVVEEAFAEIPAWHPAVAEVIPVAIRRWRKGMLKGFRSREWHHCKGMLSQHHYDCAIDAQGLLKSAFLTRYIKAPTFGYDRRSVRESMASLAYKHRIRVAKDMHAVERIRELFAKSLGYQKPAGTGCYRLDRNRFFESGERQNTVVFLHGTTRDNKHWPVPYWKQLATQVGDHGHEILLPWGNDVERERARDIASVHERARVLPRLNLSGIASVLVAARAAVAVDTGLGHLSAALDLPTVSLYGPTCPDLVGTYGEGQVHLEARNFPSATAADVEPAVFASLHPQAVYKALLGQIENR